MKPIKLLITGWFYLLAAFLNVHIQNTHLNQAIMGLLELLQCVRFEIFGKNCASTCDLYIHIVFNYSQTTMFHVNGRRFPYTEWGLLLEMWARDWWAGSTSSIVLVLISVTSAGVHSLLINSPIRISWAQNNPCNHIPGQCNICQ